MKRAFLFVGSFGRLLLLRISACGKQHEQQSGNAKPATIHEVPSRASGCINWLQTEKLQRPRRLPPAGIPFPRVTNMPFEHDQAPAYEKKAPAPTIPPKQVHRY